MVKIEANLTPEEVQRKFDQRRATLAGESRAPKVETYTPPAAGPDLSMVGLSPEAQAQIRQQQALEARAAGEPAMKNIMEANTPPTKKSVWQKIGDGVKRVFGA